MMLAGRSSSRAKKYSRKACLIVMFHEKVSGELALTK